MSQTERSRRDEEGDHPELDRAYDEAEGGQVPQGQDPQGPETRRQQPPEEYDGPDPEADPSGDASDEDQGN
jgi:hypothetical protein